MLKFLILCLLGLSAFGYTFPYDEDVLVLNDNTINAAIKQYDYLLVEFYASWCGHCKQFAPEYSQFATQVKQAGQPFIVAKLNGGDQEKQAMNRYKVSSFPTIILLIKGHAVPYNGDRSANGLKNFVTQALEDKLVRVDEIDDVYKFLSDNNLSVLYFVKDSQQPELQIYSLAAKIFPNLKFGYTTSAYARKLYDVDEGQIVLFRTFEERRKEFTDQITLEKLTNFLYENSTPSFEELDNKSYASIFNKNTPALILFWSQQSQETKDVLKLIAPNIKKRITVVSVYSDNYMLNQVTGQLFINTPTFPTTNEVYKFEGQITVENVMRFVHGANNGKIARKQKSQPIPTQTSNVLKVVGDTFDELVLNSNKSTLVQFCQTSSSKCYEPEFEDLAKELKGNENLVLAQIDLSYNDLESVKIENYPGFKLYIPKVTSNPVNFDQEFSKENLYAFVKQNVQLTHTEQNKSKSDL
ncbi:unnamed protein product (macronuclear) [Paramecium tetraurelia]|uniref:Thioredoxin domain-containing protein n=1 Tax=Paramecium tetraurelia TaxID=5888 RepID=A0DAI3_PARTE|nr:uncharacterized protein GSPATT00014957001 [Paramecium tetraurelia]CAK80050.1 unnamed protein product [Paramecium tetraurelia]|eukprot:XP_001447447.1 hypothetical protein (macronuclear) [Paramecium tetraurelia strain d4-2]